MQVTHRSVENNFSDTEKQEIQYNNSIQSNAGSVSFGSRDESPEIKAACYNSNVGSNDSNGNNSEKKEAYCKREEITLDNQKDNRTVTSIEMIDEINYFMLNNPQ